MKQAKSIEGPYGGSKLSIDLDKGKAKNITKELEENESAMGSGESNQFGLDYVITVPRWSITDYFNERTSWQKQLDSLTGEPGWFYFKLFFKFDTSYGLLGGIINNDKEGNGISSVANINTALRYLLIHNKGYHESEQLKDRAIALVKFVSMLSFINCNAPWFFNSIGGLDKVVSISEPTKNKEIEIGCIEDAVDMRLTSLFDLYKYACYDFVNYREIIPDNLRKFDLSIMIMNTPLRYWQTGFQSMNNGEFGYKGIAPDGPNYSNVVSYKMFTFTNCEFLLDSLSTVGAEINNNTPFSLGKNKIKIKYEHCYSHNMNEWDQLFWGDSGVLWDAYASEIFDTGITSNSLLRNENKKRLQAIETAIDNAGYYNKTADIYKALVDGTEKMLIDEMRAIDPSIALGNLWMQADMNKQQRVLNNIKNGNYEDLRNKAASMVKL